MLKPMEDHTEESKIDEEAARLPVIALNHQVEAVIICGVQIKIAVYASLVGNFVLAAVQREHGTVC